MISILFLAVISLIITFIIKVPVFYFLTRLFNNKIKFLISLKGLLLFEVLYFIFVCIYFGPIYSSIWLGVLVLIGIILMSGGLFVLISHFIKITSWKKSILLFVLMFLIVTPLISYLVNKITVSMVSSENVLMPDLNMLDILSDPPLYWRFIDKIGDSMGNDILIQHFMPIILNLNNVEMKTIEIEDDVLDSEIIPEDDYSKMIQGTDWEYYENEINGISIENPGGLDISASEYVLPLNGLWLHIRMHLRHSDLNHICATYILEVRDSDYLDIENWAKDYAEKIEIPWNYEGIEISNSVISSDDIEIQGRKGKKLVLEYGYPNPNIIFGIINNNKLYTIKLTDNTSGYEREGCFDEVEEGLEYRAIFDKLLSSVKFDSLIIEYPEF
jgi:hypothetical protein